MREYLGARIAPGFLFWKADEKEPNGQQILSLLQGKRVILTCPSELFEQFPRPSTHSRLKSTTATASICMEDTIIYSMEITA